MGKTLLTPRHSLNAFFRSPSQLNVRTGGSQQKLTAHFALSSIHKLKFDVYHEARQSSQLFSPDRFRRLWWRGSARQWVKCHFVYTTKSKMGSQLLLASTSSHVHLWRGSEKGIRWVPRGKQRLPHNRLSPTCCYLSSWDGKYTAWRGKSLKLFSFNIGGSTDELHPFTKSSQTGLG